MSRQSLCRTPVARSSKQILLYLLSNLKDKVYGESQLQVADDDNGGIAGTAEGDLDDDEGDVEGDEQEGDQSEPDVLHCPPQLPMQVLLVAAPGEKR